MSKNGILLSITSNQLLFHHRFHQFHHRLNHTCDRSHHDFEFCESRHKSTRLRNKAWLPPTRASLLAWNKKISYWETIVCEVNISSGRVIVGSSSDALFGFCWLSLSLSSACCSESEETKLSAGKSISRRSCSSDAFFGSGGGSIGLSAGSQ